MATAKKVKVRVLKGTHVLEEGAAPPSDGTTQGTIGRVLRPGDEATIPEELLERFPGKFQPL